MPKKRYKIVMQIGNHPAMDSLLEQFRYAGLIRPTDAQHTWNVYCPHSVGDSEQWARMNVERMRGFGWIAQVGLEQK